MLAAPAPPGPSRAKPYESPCLPRTASAGACAASRTTAPRRCGLLERCVGSASPTAPRWPADLPEDGGPSPRPRSHLGTPTPRRSLISSAFAAVQTWTVVFDAEFLWRVAARGRKAPLRSARPSRLRLGGDILPALSAGRREAYLTGWAREHNLPPRAASAFGGPRPPVRPAPPLPGPRRTTAPSPGTSGFTMTRRGWSDAPLSRILHSHVSPSLTPPSLLRPPSAPLPTPPPSAGTADDVPPALARWRRPAPTALTQAPVVPRDARTRRSRRSRRRRDPTRARGAGPDAAPTTAVAVDPSLRGNVKAAPGGTSALRESRSLPPRARPRRRQKSPSRRAAPHATRARPSSPSLSTTVTRAGARGGCSRGRAGDGTSRFVRTCRPAPRPPSVRLAPAPPSTRGGPVRRSAPPARRRRPDHRWGPHRPHRVRLPARSTTPTAAGAAPSAVPRSGSPAYLPRP